MRRTITTLFVAAVLSLPIVDATAAVKAASATKKIVVTRSFTGSTASVDRWGELQVRITVRKTTTVTGSKKKVTRRITSVSVPVYPNHTDRSVFINQQALPILRSETLRAQSANIDLVSGATDTSGAYVQSLQAAILKAKKA
jgi:uncharacterized protein with FMN-binding domain